MKLNVLKVYLTISSVLFGISSNAQIFDTLLKKLNTDYKQEKLYLQFDKAIYMPKETIWFKAYLFSGNFPSLISKSLYAELIDVNGKIIQQITVPVIMSSAAGFLNIPADIKNPVFVRAYTKWMLNFDSSFLYTKPISVISQGISADKFFESSAIKKNSVNTSVNTISPVSSAVLQFFPEGGDLILDVESRVAFKATDKTGMPVNISGEILDSKNQKVTSFTSTHDGMGMFVLHPEPNEQYKAIWNEQGRIHEVLLPFAKQKGIVLEIDNFGNSIQFKIKRSSDTTGYSFVYVVAQMHQQLLYRAKAFINKSSITTGTIPIENLPAGIIQVTVFTPEEKPLAERIVFANSSDYSFGINMTPSVKDTGKRKKNVIQIDVPDTLSCNLSVAVTDADYNSVKEKDNIYSHLLLTSDIKGFVYNPQYYFSSDADSVASHLDLVMMTNGWRRFKWEDVLMSHFPKLNYLPKNYISIEGQIKGLNKKLLAGKEINGILEFTDMKREYLNIPVQADGKFSISGMIFFDTAKFFYQFNKDKNNILTSDAIFDIKSSLSKESLYLQPNNTLALGISQPDSVIKNEEKYYDKINFSENTKSKLLNPVVVTTKKKTKQELLDEEYASGMFSNNPANHSRTILPEDDPAFLSSKTVLDYLQGRIAGLQVNPNISDNAISWRGLTTSLFVNEISQQSISIITGAIVEDASYILSIPMSEVAMIKIFDPPFFGAWGAGRGGQ